MRFPCVVFYSSRWRVPGAFKLWGGCASCCFCLEKTCGLARLVESDGRPGALSPLALRRRRVGARRWDHGVHLPAARG